MSQRESPSRREIVSSCDSERRRLERLLHDGAQQRLAAVAATLAVARRRREESGGEDSTLLEEAAAETQRSLEELRDLARRIYPTVVADRGLGAALRDLARRAPVPVELTDEPEVRLDPLLEVTAYLVASEALQALTPDSGGTRASIAALVEGGCLVVRVSDDGAGHEAWPPGVAERVRALGGVIEFSDDLEEGATVRVALPIDP